MVKNKKYKQDYSMAIRELSSYNIAKRKINELKDKRAELIEELCSVQTTDFSKVRVQGGKWESGIEELVDTINKVTKRISEDIEKNEELLAKINERLDSIDLFAGEVLHFYYIDMMTIEQIANKTYWSYGTIKNYKALGLKEYNELIKI